MKLIRTTALIAAAAAIALVAGDAFGANPVYYAPYSPAPTYTASPNGYTTYCTPNGCYRVPVSPRYGAPRAVPAYQPMPANRTAPVAPATNPFNAGSGAYNTAPSTSPAYASQRPSPFYSMSDAAGPIKGAATVNRVSAPAVKAPSQNIALNNLPSPFYP